MSCSSNIFLIKAEAYANSSNFGYPCLDVGLQTYLKYENEKISNNNNNLIKFN
jgi:hypothetical protein